MTIQPDPSQVTYLKQATNQEDADLLAERELRPIFHTYAPIVDEGPYHQGAAFDFHFGALNAGQSRTFHLYLGAAPNETKAKEALQSVSAEVYAFAKPINDAGYCTDTPSMFIIAFNGVGGNPIQF